MKNFVSLRMREKDGKRNPFDYLLAFFLLLSINFFLIRFLPGDPVSAIYGDEAMLGMNDIEKQQLLADLGLGKPLFNQWLVYLFRLTRLDLGNSYYFHQPVTEVLANFAPWTLLLVTVSLLFSLLIGFILGVEAGWRHGRIGDLGLTFLPMVCNCLPPFVLAMFILMAFGFSLEWFPLSGATEPFTTYTGFRYVVDLVSHLALPALTLCLHEISSVFFLARGTSITVLDRPFILVGRAKGVSDRTLKQKYLGANSLGPTLSRVGIMAANSLTGVLFVEVVFAYPGLGFLAHEAIMNHDYPVIQGVFLLIALVVFLVNMVTDSVVSMVAARG